MKTKKMRYSFSVDQLLEACEKRRDHQRKRLEHWQHEKNRLQWFLQQQLQGVATVPLFPNLYDEQPSYIPSELTAQWTEYIITCRKFLKHIARFDDFDRRARSLHSADVNGHKTFELTEDEVVYYHL